MFLKYVIKNKLCVRSKYTNIAPAGAIYCEGFRGIVVGFYLILAQFSSFQNQ